MLGRRWDDLVASTPDWIDPWCSRSAWQNATVEAFGGGREPYVEFGGRWGLAVAPFELEDGTPAIIGLDRVWGFGAAVVGQPSPELVGRLGALGPWRVAFLPAGAPESVYEAALVGALQGGRWRTLAGESTVRLVADLDVGWWSRRSGRFRQRLNQAKRRSPLGFETCDDLIDMDRLLAIETQSHKGRVGSGLASPDMERLYRSVIESGAANRCVIARMGHHDVGFILGGAHDRTYRGLQMSYIESVREFSVGHLMQHHEVTRHFGYRYDLGMDMTYKRHWADRQQTTSTIVLVRP